MVGQTFKTIWISDTHLGSPLCDAQSLKYFFETYSCETLYLVGDIVDAEHYFKCECYWPPIQKDILKTLLQKTQQGIKVVYLIGNHDEMLRSLFGKGKMDFGNLIIANEAVHITSKNKKLWVIHGDKYDALHEKYKALEFLGNLWYRLTFHIGYFLLSLRRYFKLSGISFLRNYFKKTFRSGYFIKKYENVIALETKRRKYDGVVCGHSHYKNNQIINGIEYWNPGDFIINNGMVVEDFSGDLHLLDCFVNSRNN